MRTLPTRRMRHYQRADYRPMHIHIYRFMYAWSIWYPFWTSDPEMDAMARAKLTKQAA